jgi:ribose transport system ATP-binding protein
LVSFCVQGGASGGGLRVSPDGCGRGRGLVASRAIEAGEVLGVAGHMGSGRSTLLKLMFGAIPLESGCIRLDGAVLDLRDPEDAIRASIGYVPEDRLGHAVLPTLSIADNLAMVNPGDYWKAGRQQRKQELADAATAIQTYGIKASSPSAPMNSLSGGNQQKVVMARWLRRGSRVLLLDEPTQAVDVGARADLWRLISDAAANGAAVVIASSDLEELAHLCQRVIVLKDGEIGIEIRGTGGLTEDDISHALHDLEAA